MRVSSGLTLTLILLFVFNYGTAQNEQLPTYEWFDQSVGPQSTGIYNGVEYREEHRVINDKHQFFRSKDFLPGGVIYEGQPYSNVKLKYNIFQNLLLVQVQSDGNESIFQLLNEKVDRFFIGTTGFLNIKDSDEYKGFAEILAENEDLSLFKLHKRNIANRRDKAFVYSEFAVGKPDHVLLYMGAYRKFDSRSDVISIFPERKREVRAFYSSNKSLRKIDPDTFLKNLFKQLVNVL